MSSSKRLAAVLRVRQIQERSARGQLAIQRRRHRLAEVAEQQTWASLDDRAAGAVGGVAGGGQDALRATRERTDVGVRAAGTQREATVAAAAGVTAAMDEWTIAARRVEGMQRLAERVASAEDEERQRLAANEIDDLVLARFGRGGPGPAAGARG